MTLTQNQIEDFLHHGAEFRALNDDNPYIWYTALATGNYSSALTNKSGFRSVLGFLRYSLFDLGFRREELPADIDLIIVSVFVQRNDDIREEFFKSLPLDLQRNDIKTAVVGKIAWHYNRDLENKARLTSEINAFFPSHLLNKIDGIKCVLKALTVRFRYPRKTTKNFINQSRLHDLIIGIMFEKMLEKFRDRNPDACILYPFEGNTWESACPLICRNTMAYQHGAITSDQYKIQHYEGRPLPKKIITTGCNASQVLNRFGHQNTINGYSLRQSDIYNYPAKTSLAKPMRKFLYLMQGGEEKNGTLDLLKAIQRECPQYAIMLRPHPAHPMTCDIGDLLVSYKGNIYDDILEADCCLYTGSTAAFESIALGVPVIQLSSAGDPLFQCSYLKQVIALPSDFKKAVDFFENECNFANDSLLARTYFENYFSKPEANFWKDFIS